MSRHQKLIEKFLSFPRDFSYDELTILLRRLGYEEMGRGKTSGSRVAFYNAEARHIIRLHKPHPSKNLRKYQMEMVLEELRKSGALP